MKILSLSALLVACLALNSCGILKQPTQLPAHILRLPGSVYKNTVGAF